MGVPEPGRYVELLNSDSTIYGGSNLGNLGALQTEQVDVDEMGHADAIDE